MQCHGRRQFLRGSAGLVVIGLLSGCSVPRLPWQPAKLHRIGFLAVGSRAGRGPVIEAFVQGLQELGYTAGQHYTIEYRFSDENNERLPELAAELGAGGVEVILASGTLAVVAAKHATPEIPIVIGASADPVRIGLVASLSRPGGNVTGISLQSPETAGKRLGVLKETVPGLSRLAVLLNVTSPAAATLEPEVRAAAQELKITIDSLPVRSAADLESALGAARAAGDQAVYPASDPLFFNARVWLAELALRQRLPWMCNIREEVEAGGLMSYGASLTGMHRRAASFVDKILKGARPADLPIEQPTTFDFVINLKTAHALGLTIPPSVLQQATAIVQ